MVGGSLDVGAAVIAACRSSSSSPAVTHGGDCSLVVEVACDSSVTQGGDPSLVVEVVEVSVGSLTQGGDWSSADNVGEADVLASDDELVLVGAVAESSTNGVSLSGTSSPAPSPATFSTRSSMLDTTGSLLTEFKSTVVVTSTDVVDDAQGGGEYDVGEHIS